MTVQPFDDNEFLDMHDFTRRYIGLSGHPGTAARAEELREKWDIVAYELIGRFFSGGLFAAASTANRAARGSCLRAQIADATILTLETAGRFMITVKNNQCEATFKSVTEVDGYYVACGLNHCLGRKGDIVKMIHEASLALRFDNKEPHKHFQEATAFFAGSPVGENASAIRKELTAAAKALASIKRAAKRVCKARAQGSVEEVVKGKKAVRSAARRYLAARRKAVALKV